MKRVWRVVSVLAVLSVTAAGYADTFSFSLTGSGYSGSGYLTAVPDASIAGVYDITSISGMINGATINGLLPCASYSASSPCTSSSLTFAYDNLLYPSGVPPFNIVQVDGAGVGFLLGSLAADVAQSSSHLDTLSFNGAPPDAPSIFVSFSVAATPEPSGFLLLGSGLIGIAMSMRRRLRVHRGIAIG